MHGNERTVGVPENNSTSKASIKIIFVLTFTVRTCVYYIHGNVEMLSFFT